MGGVLLADAILRIVLIYLLPVDLMANLSPVLHVGALAVLVGWGLWYRKQAVEQTPCAVRGSTAIPLRS